MPQDVAWLLLSSGKWGEALLWITNIYLPYNIFWILLGLVIYSVIDTKSQNASLTAVIMLFYFIGMHELMAWYGVGAGYILAMNSVTLVLIFIVIVIAYRIVKGRG
jgi:uncharacterized membrane protein